MTNDERWTLYQSAGFRQTIGISLLDWAGYWSAPGVIEQEISDETQRAQTRAAVRIITTDLSRAVKIVAALTISDDAIKAAAPDVPEETIRQAVVRVMAQKLEWLTGITPPEPDPETA